MNHMLHTVHCVLHLQNSSVRNGQEIIQHRQQLPALAAGAGSPKQSMLTVTSCMGPVNSKLSTQALLHSWPCR